MPDATDAEAQERLGNVAAALLLQLRAAGWQLFQDPITKEWLTCRATAAVAPEAALGHWRDLETKLKTSDL